MNEPLEKIVLPDIFQVTENDIDQTRDKVSTVNNAFTYALNEILELGDAYMISTGPGSQWTTGLSITGYWPNLEYERYGHKETGRWVQYIYMPVTGKLASIMHRLLHNDKSVVPFWVELYGLPDDANLLTRPTRSIYGIADQEETE